MRWRFCKAKLAAAGLENGEESAGVVIEFCHSPYSNQGEVRY